MRTVNVARARRGITRFCPRCRRDVYVDVESRKNKWIWYCTECGRRLPYDPRPKIKPTWGFVKGIPVYRWPVGQKLIKLLKYRIKEEGK